MESNQAKCPRQAVTISELPNTKKLQSNEFDQEFVICGYDKFVLSYSEGNKRAVTEDWV